VEVFILSEVIFFVDIRIGLFIIGVYSFSN
ncbi:uncharacterized protein METZ01_LOCUS443583, partial [marine metagenome]